MTISVFLASVVSASTYIALAHAAQVALSLGEQSQDSPRRLAGETTPVLADQDWFEFRGPQGAGAYQQADPLPSKLDLEDALLWKVPVPEGHSSPIAVGDLILITGYEDKQLVVLAIDRRNGRTLWKQQVAVESLEKTYQHGPATPTAASDGANVYVVFGSFGILAYDLTGREIWREEWTVAENLYGTAASPILVDKKLVVLKSDQKQAALRAYDKSNGTLLWERVRQEPASTWSTPVLVRRSDHDLLLIYEPFHLRAYHLSDGTEVWSVPGLADEPITIPQLAGDLVIVTSYNMGTNREVIGVPTFEDVLKECDANHDRQLDKTEVRANRSVLSRPDADGEGDHPLRIFFRMIDEDKDGLIEESEWPRLQAWVDAFKHANGFVALRLAETEDAPTVQWQQERGVPECPTPICANGVMFAVRNGGVLTCMDTKSGEIRFHERLVPGGPYYSSPVAGDDKLFFASARGEVSVVSATMPPRLLSTVNLGEPIWATPALTGGAIIVRSKSTLWSFGRAEKEAGDSDAGQTNATTSKK